MIWGFAFMKFILFSGLCCLFSFLSFSCKDCSSLACGFALFSSER